MFMSAVCVNLRVLHDGHKDEVFSLAYFPVFFVRSLASLCLFGRYFYREDIIQKKDWDGSTLGLSRSQLISYLYEKSFSRLIKFYRLRVVWDFIILEIPAIVLVAANLVSFSLFCFLFGSLAITNLLAMPYIMHSWCMKGRYRMRAI